MGLPTATLQAARLFLKEAFLGFFGVYRVSGLSGVCFGDERLRVEDASIGSADGFLV